MPTLKMSRAVFLLPLKYMALFRAKWSSFLCQRKNWTFRAKVHHNNNRTRFVLGCVINGHQHSRIYPSNSSIRSIGRKGARTSNSTGTTPTWENSYAPLDWLILLDFPNILYSGQPLHRWSEISSTESELHNFEPPIRERKRQFLTTYSSAHCPPNFTR